MPHTVHDGWPKFSEISSMDFMNDERWHQIIYLRTSSGHCSSLNQIHHRPYTHYYCKTATEMPQLAIVIIVSVCTDTPRSEYSSFPCVILYPITDIFFRSFSCDSKHKMCIKAVLRELRGLRFIEHMISINVIPVNNRLRPEFGRRTHTHGHTFISSASSYAHLLLFIIARHPRAE